MNETPSSNASLCSELIREGILRVRPLDALAGEVPPLEVMPDPDRIAGMLLGRTGVQDDGAVFGLVERATGFVASIFAETQRG